MPRASLIRQAPTRLRGAVCHCLLLGALASGQASAELAADPLDVYETLPVPYPAHWIFVHDAAFFHMFEGKMILLDPTRQEKTEQYKGMLNTSFLAPFARSDLRRELYAVDLFYSRGWTGERTDVVTIYDQATLEKIDEIVLPFAKRSMTMPEKFAAQLIDHDRFLLVFNMNPATSVSVVDVARRAFVTEIEIPACALTYPTGPRGFSTLCGDGSMVSVQLDADGRLKSRERVAAFFDPGGDPLFEEGTIIEGVGYFPTFHGDVQEIDFRGDTATVGQRWSLVSERQRAMNWRPGGHQITAADKRGRLYVLMQPDGGEGTHKDGGSEVWVYDVAERARVQRTPLQHWGNSIAVTAGTKPQLIVNNPEDMTIDVYDARSGTLERTLEDFGMETSFLVYTMHQGE